MRRRKPRSARAPPSEVDLDSARLGSQRNATRRNARQRAADDDDDEESLFNWTLIRSAPRRRLCRGGAARAAAAAARRQPLRSTTCCMLPAAARRAKAGRPAGWRLAATAPLLQLAARQPFTVAERRRQRPACSRRRREQCSQLPYVRPFVWLPAGAAKVDTNYRFQWPTGWLAGWRRQRCATQRTHPSGCGGGNKWRPR